MMSMPLEKEFSYYKSHQDELVRQYNGRVIVIVGETVIGDYDTELQALLETKKAHKPGTFFIQKCGPGEENYTQTFHSRVAFS